MKLYLIRVSGLLHHVTSRPERHWTYAADLRAAGHDVATEERG